MELLPCLKLKLNLELIPVPDELHFAHWKHTKLSFLSLSPLLKKYENYAQ